MWTARSQTRAALSPPLLFAVRSSAFVAVALGVVMDVDAMGGVDVPPEEGGGVERGAEMLSCGSPKTERRGASGSPSAILGWLKHKATLKEV